MIQTENESAKKLTHILRGRSSAHFSLSSREFRFLAMLDCGHKNADFVLIIGSKVYT